jgi:hypothetical protein
MSEILYSYSMNTFTVKIFAIVLVIYIELNVLARISHKHCVDFQLWSRSKLSVGHMFNEFVRMKIKKTEQVFL